jgi:hypothetical protein
MANHTGRGCFRKGESGNPGGRPKLPAEMREMFRAKAPEAFEVLSRHLQSPDAKVAIAAATQILDRAYGRPVQSIDANINDDPVRYIVELPEKSATTEEWLEGIKREDAGRALVTSVAAAVDDEQTHSAEPESALSRG